MDVGCETDLRAVRDGLIGGVLRGHLFDAFFELGTSGLDFFDKPLKPLHDS